MNKVEYLILRSALEFPETLVNIAEDYKISNAEVARVANKLFQNGDILAEIVDDEDDILGDSVAVEVKSSEHRSTPVLFPKATDDESQKPSIPIFKEEKLIVLTPSQIEANFKRELGALYCLTPQGGARWESVTHPDWNRYYTERISFNEFGEIAIAESQVICSSKQFLEKFLTLDCYVHDIVHIPGTEVWDVLEPWQATYWKILPKGYRLRFQGKQNYVCIDSDTPPEWIEANDQANEWYCGFRKWYTNPKFD